MNAEAGQLVHYGEASTPPLYTYLHWLPTHDPRHMLEPLRPRKATARTRFTTALEEESRGCHTGFLRLNPSLFKVRIHGMRLEVGGTKLYCPIPSNVSVPTSNRVIDFLSCLHYGIFERLADRQWPRSFAVFKLISICVLVAIDE